jgi:RimJ/RimL family protein N-acetyltransferase
MDLAATTLTHPRLRLDPFVERHRDGLIAAAADPAIWRHMPFPVVERGYGAWFDVLREEQAAGRWLPHAVISLANGKATIVGQSCYINPRPKDCAVEIGGTWYAAAAQGGFVNPAAKLLLLGHAFASGAERVELKTDALNARSRAAMMKLGCTFEGIHRQHMRRPDGSWRDTAWFSILREEWPGVRARLEARVAESG